jgi:hypothetical protein
MFSPAFISLVVIAALHQQAPVTIVQKTSGWCSPVIANVIGNVTVNCIGVDLVVAMKTPAESSAWM